MAGIDHIGIGADFDGMDSQPEGLEDVSKYPALLAELLRRGYSEDDVQEDRRPQRAARMRAAEGVAQRLQKARGPSKATIEELDSATSEVGAARMPRLTKIYTRKGDDGSTGLGGGQRVAKDSPRVAAYGTVDELNSAIGVALAHGLGAASCRGAAADPERAVPPRLGPVLPRGGQGQVAIPQIEPRHVDALEALIDELNDVVGPLANFILPGGAPGAAHLHVARTICRRAERDVLTLSRLEPMGKHALSTSTGCRTRCSSWRATRTTSAASPSRYGTRRPRPSRRCGTSRLHQRRSTGSSRRSSCTADGGEAGSSGCQMPRSSRVAPERRL